MKSSETTYDVKNNKKYEYKWVVYTKKIKIFIIQKWFNLI